MLVVVVVEVVNPSLATSTYSFVCVCVCVVLLVLVLLLIFTFDALAENFSALNERERDPKRYLFLPRIDLQYASTQAHIDAFLAWIWWNLRVLFVACVRVCIVHALQFAYIWEGTFSSFSLSLCLVCIRVVLTSQLVYSTVRIQRYFKTNFNLYIIDVGFCRRRRRRWIILSTRVKYI